MNESPLISVCIPAYKRIDYLQKLLHSISIQTFKDYEVIITDDSPDDSVEKFVKSFNEIQSVYYYRNEKVLGTPENWNESIRRAKGIWIKLMHDDDWFESENSLMEFYNFLRKKPECNFIFSAHHNVSGDQIVKTVYLKSIGRFLLSQSPLNLFKKIYIGNPSCTLIKRDLNIFYDNRFKWVVDFEYFIRCLKTRGYGYINLPLINIGLNDEQVTKFSFRVPEIEIPENQLLIEKSGVGILRNINVYDYYWRYYRNLKVRSESDIKKYYSEPLHPLLKQMINFQKKIALNILKVGVISKLLMTINYFYSLLRKT